MPANATILVVEDEPKLIRLLKMSFEADGYRVLVASEAKTALELIRDNMPDLVILDIMLSGSEDGYWVCRTLRSFSDVPVIMLTARSRESEKLEGFECGADDYVTKPFSYPELRARVKAILSRNTAARSAGGSTAFSVGELKIDYLRRRVYMKDREVHLTPTEYNVLQQLATNAGKVLLHEELLTKIWGIEYRDEYQYLRNYISNLRKKLEPDPAKPRYILSKPGVGYYMSDK